MISFLRKLSWLCRRGREESDLREEIAFHLEAEIEEKEKEGLTSEAARRAAVLQFGNPVLVQEDVRKTWSWTFLDQLWQDLTYGIRGFWRARGFTLGAVG